MKTKKSSTLISVFILASCFCFLFIMFCASFAPTAAAAVSSDVPVSDLIKDSDSLWLKIVKSEYRLYVMKGDEAIKTYGIATGKNTGQKKRVGDNRTPEGKFEVEQIQNSSGWQHDFKDGKGMVKGAYGPWFIRIKCGWKGIGIHGTHDPDSIGKNATEGCIRLKNPDLVDLKDNYVKLSMKVVITD